MTEEVRAAEGVEAILAPLTAQRREAKLKGVKGALAVYQV